MNSPPFQLVPLFNFRKSPFCFIQEKTLLFLHRFFSISLYAVSIKTAFFFSECATLKEKMQLKKKVTTLDFQLDRLHHLNVHIWCAEFVFMFIRLFKTPSLQ